MLKRRQQQGPLVQPTREAQELLKTIKPDTWEQFCKGYTATLSASDSRSADRAVYAGLSVSYSHEIMISIEAMARETVEYVDIKNMLDCSQPEKIITEHDSVALWLHLDQTDRQALAELQFHLTGGEDDVLRAIAYYLEERTGKRPLDTVTLPCAVIATNFEVLRYADHKKTVDSLSSKGLAALNVLCVQRAKEYAREKELAKLSPDDKIKQAISQKTWDELLDSDRQELRELYRPDAGLHWDAKRYARYVTLQEKVGLPVTKFPSAKMRRKWAIEEQETIG